MADLNKVSGVAIRISYDEVVTVSTLLRQVTNEIVPRLVDMQEGVANLLTPGGGLWLIKSSDVLEDKYDQFNAAITEAVESIPLWADQFDNIVSQLQSMDEQIVEAANADG